MAVPAVLTSGDHAKIAEWRRARSVEKTARVRPDLLARASLSQRELAILDSMTDRATSPEEG